MLTKLIVCAVIICFAGKYLLGCLVVYGIIGALIKMVMDTKQF